MTDKQRKEILNKAVLKTQDVIALTGFSERKSREYMKAINKKYKNELLPLPYGRDICVPTELFRKELRL